MSYDYPWLKDTIQYDPYEDPDYPQPQESEVERPKYRSPTIDKSVRVYTVAQESRYLIIRNIPLTGVIDELIKQLALYGTIEEYNYLTSEPSAPFTLSIWVRFQQVSAARQAKFKMNKTSFFGQDLWIQYAPEFESPDDALSKLNSRRIAIKKRLEELVIERPDEMVHEYKRKGRIPVESMTTSGLLGEEEAIPAGDFVQSTKQIIDKDINTTVSSIEGISKEPLKRKSTYKLPVLQRKEIGVLREGEREVQHNSMELKVSSVLDRIEKQAEETALAPPVKKRRRI